MARMRTTKTKRAPERAEEPVEPVKATKSAPANHAATDALLDTIEDVLDPVTADEAMIKSLWEKFKLVGFDPARDTLQFLPTPRTADEQEMLYEQWLREREQRFEPEPIPWAEIAKLPMPPPGGTEVVFAEPVEVEWDYQRDDAVCIQSSYRERHIRVTVEMWREAQFRAGPARPRERSYGDDGICRRCGWPLAGPGGPPCGNAGTRPNTPYRWPVMPPVDPTSITRITNC